MSQEKAAEIIDLNATRAASPGQSRIEKAGEFLANARQAAGFGLEAVSTGTKIKIEHLEAIEKNRPDNLPATPYAVGFVKVYARFLDLDAEAVAAQFKDDIGAAALSPVELSPTPIQTRAALEIGEGVRLASVFGILSILVFAGWVAFKILGANEAVIEGPSEPRLTMVAAADESITVPAPANTPFENTSKTKASVDNDISLVAPIETPQEITEVQIDAEAAAAELAVDEIAPAVAQTTETIADPIVNAPAPLQDTPAPRRSRAKTPVVISSKLTRSMAPIYPNQCGSGAGAVESVTVMFDVTVAGRTGNARVLSSTNSCFDKSALRTVKRWRFDPKTVDGAAKIDTGKTATLNFRQ